MEVNVRNQKISWIFFCPPWETSHPPLVWVCSTTLPFNFPPFFQQYSPLLKAFTSQGLSEVTLLLKIQEYCYDNIHFMKAFQKIVVLLYKGKLFVLPFPSSHVWKNVASWMWMMPDGQRLKPKVCLAVVNMPDDIYFSSTCRCICAFEVVLNKIFINLCILFSCFFFFRFVF